MTDHRLTVGRFVRGKTPIRPTRNLYGTSGRCSCGWKGRSNEAPSAGGRKRVQDQHRAHLSEVE